MASSSNSEAVQGERMYPEVEQSFRPSFKSMGLLSTSEAQTLENAYHGCGL